MTDTSIATPDSKVLICLTHGAEEPENVLIAYLLGDDFQKRPPTVLVWETDNLDNLGKSSFAYLFCPSS